VAQAAELTGLRVRLADADETLRAISAGEIDTVMVAGRQGRQVFTLDGADRAYRVLIESMNEGAVTLTTDKMILYANSCFARMVKCPLEQVTGGSFRRFLSVADCAAFRPLVLRAGKAGSKLQVRLKVSDGSQLPVQLSICRLAKNGFSHAPVAVVVADLTASQRIEELLRALNHRVQQVQEDERVRVALELHDHITQLLCAILFRCQALVDELSARGGPSLQEAMKLREMLGQTAREVERISRNLRPGVLDQLGLESVLRATSTEFAERTGLAVKLVCPQLSARLPAAAELALYRILQEALKNVGQHARARHVTVILSETAGVVQLVVNDDGVGFDPGQPGGRRKALAGLGLLAMRERAAYVGGVLELKSIRRSGTQIIVRIPLPATAGTTL
jgi:two-component system NarL family sensor kinase